MNIEKAPTRVPYWAWLVIFTLLVLLFTAILTNAKNAKAANDAVAAQAVTTVDTSGGDATTQTRLDNCSAAFHQLANDAAKDADLFTQTTMIANEAVQAAGTGDVATLSDDTAKLSSVGDQVGAVTDDVKTIDGSACE